jgi:hypothetical protein
VYDFPLWRTAFRVSVVGYCVPPVSCGLLFHVPSGFRCRALRLHQVLRDQVPPGSDQISWYQALTHDPAIKTHTNARLLCRSFADTSSRAKLPAFANPAHPGVCLLHVLVRAVCVLDWAAGRILTKSTVLWHWCSCSHTCAWNMRDMLSLMAAVTCGGACTPLLLVRRAALAFALAV